MPIFSPFAAAVQQSGRLRRQVAASQKAATTKTSPKAARTDDAPFLHLLRGAKDRRAAAPSHDGSAGSQKGGPKPGTAAFLLMAGKMRRGEADTPARQPSAERSGKAKPGTAGFLIAAGKLRRGEAP
jgi:hypothetical protein